jgi:putative phosphoesterase
LSTTLGLIADTHVPDRRRDLHPRILPIFREAGVSTILHAGDIAVPRVLKELAQVAPVTAVRGNRDWIVRLPYHRTLTVEDVRIGLTHGHGSWGQYGRDKLRFLLRGPQTFEYFMQRAISLAGNVDVVVFGHNHEPMVKDVDGKLVVNPGSACCQMLPGKPPSVALLHIDGDKASAEIVNLD